MENDKGSWGNWAIRLALAYLVFIAAFGRCTLEPNTSVEEVNSTVPLKIDGLYRLVLKRNSKENPNSVFIELEKQAEEVPVVPEPPIEPPSVEPVPPNKVSKLIVLIVEERRERSIELNEVINDKDVVDYLKTHSKQWRIWDDDFPQITVSEKRLKDLYFSPRTKVPWIYVQNDFETYSGEFNFKTKDELLTLLKKYGGE